MQFRSYRLGLATAAWVALPSCAPVDPGPLTPGQALESFRIADGFRVELFASEPHVTDPVDLVFDENGGAWVAELLDNPEDPPPGQPPLSRIKYLEDTDGDGTVDRHTVFADRLLALEGIAPWKGGLIATSAPDILYLKDTDGDRKSDVREILYTGFGLGNVERRISNPRLGIDNWIHVANNGYEGEIRSPSRPGAAPVNVRNREFRFHPLRGLAGASTGNAQFGHDSNERGHWFVAQNTVHLRHVVIPPGYLERNPFHSLARAEQDISDHGRPAAPVFPLSRPQRWRVERTRIRQQRYDETRPGQVERLGGYFTAAAGTTVYSGDSFPQRLSGSVFVGEGNGNLVHCDLLEPAGPTYSASRWPEGSDFLASTDSWFRPVNFSNAPDGNLYVLDYYRQYLETPVSIPEAVQRRLRMDFRNGDTLGRIYRIVPDGPQDAARKPRLGDASSAALAATLAHPNGWHRATAHRLLIERQDASVAARLRDLTRTADLAATRVRALWVLEGLGRMDPEIVRSALADRHPSVRENGLRLAEAFLPAMAGGILRATADEHPRVAFQAALSAGWLELSDRTARALAGALSRHPDDSWFHAAVLCAPPGFAVPVLEALLASDPTFAKSDSADRRGYARAAGNIIGARRNAREVERFLGLAAGLEGSDAAGWRAAALAGLRQGLSLQDGVRMDASRASRALDKLLGDSSGNVRTAAGGIARYFELGARVERAKAVASDPQAPPSERMLAARILQGSDLEHAGPALVQMLRPESGTQMQLAAVESLASFDGPVAAGMLLAAWEGSDPVVRDAIAGTLIRRKSHAAALVRAISEGRVGPRDIPAVTRIRLRQHPDAGIRSEAEAGLAPAGRDRDEVVRSNLQALDLPGDAELGAAVFERECASCHRASAARGRIGPDLSGVSNRSREDLLTSILDPSYSIESRYRNHLLETKDGRFHDGILVAETAVTLTLRGEAHDVTVLKADIASLRESDVSLMPEGLEDAMTPEQLADVIAYLRAGL